MYVLNSDLIFHTSLRNSNTGKRLMAKCRMLYQENEDLGKMISSGRLAKLESDLALQKSLTEEMKKSQSGNTCIYTPNRPFIGS